MERRLPLLMLLGVLALFVSILAAPGVASALPTASGALEPGSMQSGTPEPAPPADAQAVPTPTSLLEELIMTRTPEPTATPDRIERELEELVETVGLARTTFLGLSVVNWINLAISLLFVVVGFLIGTWLIRSVLPRTAKRTPTEFDDRFLEAIGGEVRWLVVLLTLYLGTSRLTFVNAKLKSFLSDAYFVVALVIASIMVLKLINLGAAWSQERALAQARGGQLQPLIVLLSRVGRVFVVVLALAARYPTLASMSRPLPLRRAWAV